MSKEQFIELLAHFFWTFFYGILVIFGILGIISVLTGFYVIGPH